MVIHVIYGGAGTGKTQRLAEYIMRVQKNKLTYVALAPTHSAKCNLFRRCLSMDETTSINNFMTIYAYFMIDWKDEIVSGPKYEVEYIFIDEFSLIKKELFKKMMIALKIRRFSSHIFICGDVLQLNPIYQSKRFISFPKLYKYAEMNSIIVSSRINSSANESQMAVSHEGTALDINVEAKSDEMKPKMSSNNLTTNLQTNSNDCLYKISNGENLLMKPWVIEHDYNSLFSTKYIRSARHEMMMENKRSDETIINLIKTIFLSSQPFSFPTISFMKAVDMLRDDLKFQRAKFLMNINKELTSAISSHEISAENNFNGGTSTESFNDSTSLTSNSDHKEWVVLVSKYEHLIKFNESLYKSIVLEPLINSDGINLGSIKPFNYSTDSIGNHDITPAMKTLYFIPGHKYIVAESTSQFKNGEELICIRTFPSIYLKGETTFEFYGQVSLLPMNLLTAHKAQGMGFKHIIIVLDDLFDISMLYTMISRAMHECKFIWISSGNEQKKQTQNLYESIEKFKDLVKFYGYI